MRPHFSEIECKNTFLCRLRMKCHDFETDRNVVKSCLRRIASSWLPIQDGNYVLWTARLALIARAKIAWIKNVHARRVAYLSQV